jgi:hypothetical protein
MEAEQRTVPPFRLVSSQVKAGSANALLPVGQAR